MSDTARGGDRPGSDGPRGLLLDYGGVLTTPPGWSFRAFERAHGIPDGRVVEVLVAASRGPDAGLIGAIERGEITPADLDTRLRELLLAEGIDVPDGSLLDGLFAEMRPDGPLWGVVRQVRAAGVRTGLLSNSWGTATYPRDRLAEHFEAIVISGEVGLRKPDPAIFALAAEQLGCEAHRVAFVDDLAHNVAAARTCGMFAVHHDGDARATVEALAGFLEVDLSVDTA